MSCSALQPAIRSPRNVDLFLAALVAGGVMVFGWNAPAATYLEIGGIVVVEAEHFDSRTTAQDNDHHWAIAPDELSADDAALPLGAYQNARGGKYLVVLPDVGENRSGPDAQAAGPAADYKVRITTPGDYTLFVRDTAYDGNSDSFYVRIPELEKANGRPGPDWYRYNPNPTDSDFNTDKHGVGDGGWDNMLTPEVNDAGGGEQPATWTIASAGVYTIRIQQREDGNGVDALALQLATLPAPPPDIPESPLVDATPQPLTILSRLPAPGAKAAAFNSVIQAVLQDGTTTLDQSSIALQLDGNAVGFSKAFTNGVTTVLYRPDPVFLARSTHTVSLVYKDNTAAAATDSWSFAVQDYVTIPVSAAVQADTNKPGFLVRTWQVESATPNGVAKAEAVLAGQLGPNIADTSSFTDAAYGDKYFDEITVINYWDTGGEGNFPNNFTPNVPGIASPGDNWAVEIITFLQLPAGPVRMGVNSDDGFRTTFFASGDPRDRFAAILGQFDGGRGASDTQFQFVVEQAGVYPFRTVWEEGGGDASCEWFTVAPDRTRHLINDPADAMSVKAYRAVITAAAAGPIATRIAPMPGATAAPPDAAVEVDLKDGATSVDPASVALKVDGSPTPPSVNKSGDMTSLKLPSTGLWASNSVHMLELTYGHGSPATVVTQKWSFTVEPYVTLPADFAVGAPDAARPGFSVRVSQIEGTQPNTIAFTERQLAGTVTNLATGLPYPNVATPNPADGSFVYAEPAVINYDASGTLATGSIVPDAPMPGLPGTLGATDNSALEVLTYVDLPAGLIRMGVNSDDGFRLSPATSVSDPRNALTLGVFNGARGAGDTLFDIAIQQAGTYPMRLVWENGNGGVSLEWFSVNRNDGSRVLVNASTNSAAIKAYRDAAPGTVQPAPQITSATIANGAITIRWTNGGTLQSSPGLAAPDWKDRDASGTFSEPATGTQFYRVKRL